jgi:predicted NBD/HSP70 family sugar kinase
MGAFGLLDRPEAGSPDDIPRLFHVAAAGHPTAEQAVAVAGTAMGHAIASLLQVFDVPLVVISGGIADALPSLRPALLRAMTRQGPAGVTGRVRIVAGTLGPDAGCIGAAALHRASVRT